MDLKRESYLEKIRPFYETDLIKVISGVVYYAYRLERILIRRFL